MFESREARIANYEKVVEYLAPIFRSRPRAAWCETLRALEVPHAPVNTSEEVVESEQAKALQLCIEDRNGPHGPFRTIRSPVTFDGQRALDVTAPPVLGAHDEALVAPLRKTLERLE
jgi:crotonobetainyl-CoA:carnitine CoA-transferase CaiB-like acyl-CoA transferase